MPSSTVMVGFSARRLHLRVDLATFLVARRLFV